MIATQHSNPTATGQPRRLRRNEPLARHTSWRAGGSADIWFRPADRAQLLEFLPTLDPGMPLHWLGLGSNLLVRDGGVRGAVIAVQDALNKITVTDDGQVCAEAGVPCTVLARRCVREQLGPAEFFAGIPGTVGGALAMNAGAFGGECWNHVAAVETVDRAARIRQRQPQDYQIAYREVRGPAHEWFLSATFRFEHDPAASMERIRTLVNERREKQPLGLPSCGSVFRNPPGDHAARLIEAAGLKGCRIGAAEVSPKHANFIINTGGATAADIEALILHVQAGVKAHSGIDLVPEVHIIGERVVEN